MALTIHAAYYEARALWPDRVLVLSCAIHTEIDKPQCTLTFLRTPNYEAFGAATFEECIERAKAAKV